MSHGGFVKLSKLFSEFHWLTDWHKDGRKQLLNPSLHMHAWGGWGLGSIWKLAIAFIHILYHPREPIGISLPFPLFIPLSMQVSVDRTIFIPYLVTLDGSTTSSHVVSSKLQLYYCVMYKVHRKGHLWSQCFLWEVIYLFVPWMPHYLAQKEMVDEMVHCWHSELHLGELEQKLVDCPWQHEPYKRQYNIMLSCLGHT